jgi:hypothetical protein
MIRYKKNDDFWFSKETSYQSFNNPIKGFFSVIILMCFLSSCSSERSDLDEEHTYEYTGKLITNKDRKEHPKLDIVNDYLIAVKQSLKKPIPILTLSKEELTNQDESRVQEIVVQNQDFTKYTRHPKGNKPLRNEIMTIRKVLASDISSNNKERLEKCGKSCYRVEMYNFFYNMSTVAFVDAKLRRVLAVNYYSDAQPDINNRLKNIAITIAKNSKLVSQELFDVNQKPTMSQIKTSLKNSRCERSYHLCVAPTFVLNDKALWAIVDLTDSNLVGIRWTKLGESGPPIDVTERQLENEYVFREFCEKSHHLQKDHWQFNYQITASDGIEVTQVMYKNIPVMKSAKLLDWHVNYSTREGFGYSDAIGCPLFSSAVVIAYEGPQVEEIKKDGKTIGFSFTQDFRQPPWPTPCNYRYEQRFEFYNDGRFRVAAADYGRGCGTDGTYRPIIRIDIDADKDHESISQWDGEHWKLWNEEKWHLQSKNTKYTREGYLFKITNEKGNGFYVEPNRGQFNDGSKGDNAFSYISINHPDRDEGSNDMVTMGSCCNTDFRQGPEQFINPPESLQNRNLVLWYVPQLKNNGTKGEEYCWADTRIVNGIKNVKVWPCYAGPMFVPVGL